jgi:hypothetical protein
MDRYTEPKISERFGTLGIEQDLPFEPTSAPVGSAINGSNQKENARKSCHAYDH